MLGQKLSKILEKLLINAIPHNLESSGERHGPLVTNFTTFQKNILPHEAAGCKTKWIFMDPQLSDHLL